ncbi:uncharacterized protein LOC125046684 [Penaeus chinensis]|uniref:uncharacterized protein LOC125046684 n=1 Tax=Penaeus chinensis TaxID=139456 RepID=UPI001FB81C0D|nr:uncharacterized protein LOC125046684 [Penaeus chinensis]
MTILYPPLRPPPPNPWLYYPPPSASATARLAYKETLQSVWSSLPHPSTMRHQVALLVLAVVAVVSNGQEYSTEEVIRNLQTTADAEELVECVLGSRQPGLPCRDMFVHFKRFLPDIFENNCRSCTNQQKDVMQEAAVFLQRRHKAYFNQLSRGVRRSFG